MRDPRELVPVAPEFFVADVAASVRFYTERLQFDLRRDERPVFAVVGLGDATILLAQDALYTGPRAELDGRGAGVDVRIMVADAGEIYKRVRAAGVEIVHEIGDRAYGLRDFIVRDPEGFRLRFASPLS